METKFITLTRKNPESFIYCVLDIDISEDYISEIIKSNQEYFDLFVFGYTQMMVIKFEHIESKIIMRTFSNTGHETATYYVLENKKLYLYEGDVTNGVFYKKHGLNVVEYEENNEGIMIYCMLDDDDLDPVGDGFTLDEAILFVDNYLLAHNLSYE